MTRDKAGMKDRTSIKQSGFTLIEVLVAMAVLAATFGVMLSSFSYHLKIYDRKQQELKLILKAKEYLYIYKLGKLGPLNGEKDGIRYMITVEDALFSLSKISSTVTDGQEEVSVFEYIRK